MVNYLRSIDKRWEAGIALIVLTFVAYIPSLMGKFIWDDYWMVVDNQLIRTVHGLGQIWLHPRPDPYPITLSALWLEWHLGGGSPLVFHVVSIITHAIGAVLFWRVLLRLSVPAAWYIAGLFAVHPVGVASAAWITEQKNTISIIFYLLTVLLYLRYDQTGAKKNYWFALVAFVCALLSKGSTIVAPAIFALIVWWRPRKGHQQFRRYLGIIPFFVIAAGDAALVIVSQESNAIGFATVQHLDGLERVLAAAREIWLYAWNDIAPVKLAAVYTQWRVDGNDGMAYLPLLALCLVAGTCWWFRKRWGMGAFVGLTAFIITLLPVLGFVDMAFLMFSRTADHLEYLALLAILPLVVVAGRYLLQRMFGEKPPSATIMVSVATIVLAGCFVLTWMRASVYTTNERLWADNLRKYPNAWMACVNLGHIYLEQQKFPEAIELYSRATTAEPHRFEGEDGIGKACERMGKPAEAITHFVEAAKIVKDSASAIALQKANLVLPEVRTVPDLYTAHLQLAMMLVKTSRTLEALPHFRSMVTLRPQDYVAHGSLANALAILGFTDGAIEEFKTATQLQPADPRTRYNLATALVTTGRLDEALFQFQQCTKLVPASVDYRIEYAKALIKAGRFDEAGTEINEARRIDPNNTALAQLCTTLSGLRK